MSHSVFKEFPATSSGPFGGGGPNNNTGNSTATTTTPDERDNVVIVLNKDGSVSVDQHALHSFLRDEAGKTAVSVVRVQSPTPSLEEELRELGPSSDEDDSSNGGEPSGESDNEDSSDRSASGDETDSDAEEDEDDEEVDSASDSDKKGQGRQQQGRKGAAVAGGKRTRKKNKRVKERVPHVRLTVEQYLSPDQAKIFAAEILQYAGMSSGLSLDVDYDYQRFVVQNDHCYTPLTSPSQKDSGGGAASATTGIPGSLQSISAGGPVTFSSKGRRRIVTEKATLVTPGGRKANNKTKEAAVNSKSKEAASKSKEASTGVIDVDSSDNADPDSDEELDEGEEDQSDDDYSLSESENDRDSDLDFRVNSNYLPKKKKKNNLKAQKSQNSSSAGVSGSGSGIGSARGKDRESLGSQSGVSGGSSVKSGQQSALGLLRKQRQSLIGASSSSGIKTLGPARHKDPEREDRPLHQPKLPFKSAAVSKATTHTAPHSTINQQQQQLQHQQRQRQIVRTNPPPVVHTPPTPVSQQKKVIKQDPLFTDMSSLFATPDIIKKVGGGGDGKSSKKEEVVVVPQIQLPSAFDLDLINSLVSDDMETRKSAAAAAASIAEKSVPTDDNLDLNDASLLDGIVGDDGLPEELLQHVAELVENKSLQEVIDKQVLGVEDPMAHLTNLLPKAAVTPMPTTTPTVVQQQQQPKKESPFVKLAQQKQLAKQSAAAAASLTAPRKEPIKIVRSDGRVITLPPIEAPTTRGAKRRAQNSMDATTPSPVTPARTPSRDTIVEVRVESTANNSMNESSMVEILSASLLPEVAAPVSARKKSGSDRGSTSRRASTTPSVADSDMDMEFSSEDDPNRLWCICKTPHNNRFMICCDTCEDWFHGKCVNITKAMGQQMEAAGKEWTCPNCVLGLTGNEQVCMVCRQRPAKPDSVYCSDECIVKHANKTQQQQQQHQLQPSPQTPKPPMVMAPGAPRIVPGKPNQPAEGNKVRIGLLKNAQGRVIVYHKKTKQCLSGDNAPFLGNIKEWLAQNPDYAIVAPGSEVAEAFKAKQAQLQQLKVRSLQKQASIEQPQSPQQDKIQSKLKFGTNKQVVIVHPKTAQQIKVDPSGKSSPVTEKSPHSMKAPRKTAPEATTSGATAASSPMGQRNVQRGEVEPIRLTVRKTLKEHLAQRMLEVKEGGAKLTADEIEQFALETEQEMFSLFSRDTGLKYKAKYRSLVFNIKDRKNETLFQKICEKVKPYRLVRMSPEELASQELAKWRENENKHQLDMIKKSEMDLLACAKSYVLKSHKGEEVIENMIMDNQIETVDDVTMLSGLAKEGEDGAVTEGGEDRHKSSGHDSRSKDKKRDRSRDRDRDRDKHRSHHSSSSSSKHKRKRSRERSRERDKERERTKEKGSIGGGVSSSSKHKSSSGAHHSHHSAGGGGGSSSHHHHSSSKDKDKSSSGKKETSSSSSSRHKDKVQSIKEESNHSSSPASTASSTNNKSSSGEASSAAHVYKPSKKETEESYDLIEKILQGTSPELVAKLHEMEKQKSLDVKDEENSESNEAAGQAVTPVKVEEPVDEEYNPESANPLRSESPTGHPREIWSGKVIYQDIAQFQGSLLPLYGETNDVLPDFPTVFDVQGRIGPEVVWDYLGKIKRSVNRDITVVRFVPRSTKEHSAYETMYSYFETKGRLGVLKPKSDIIKDFYLVPQKKGKLLPSVLLTLKGLGSYETKANCIVGIVVKATMKRPSSSTGGGPSNKIMKKTQPVVTELKQQQQHNTPPGSPKMGHKLTAGLPKASPAPMKTDDDEPYSPGGSEEEDSAMDTLPAPVVVAPPAPAIVPYELQKEVERLNRQIEAQKNEIVEMLAKDPLEEEPYSPSRPMSPSERNKDKVSAIPLANISIPSNLQEILASLKNVGAPTAIVGMQQQQEEEDDEEEYNPVPISSSSKLSTETYKPRPTSPSTRAYLLSQQQQGEEIPFLSDSAPSKLSHMTDAELMSLVPDGVDLGPPKSAVEPMPPGLGDDGDEEYDPSQ